MRTRRFKRISLGLAAVGLLAAGCAEQTAAIKVGDDYMSRSDFTDWLETIEDVQREQFGDGVIPGLSGAVDGAYDQDFTSGVARDRIEMMVAAYALDDLGLEVTDEMRAGSRDSLSATAPFFATLSADVQDLVVEEEAVLAALTAGTGRPWQEVVGIYLNEVDIEVSSRIGTWDDELRTIIPPPGPLVDVDGPDSGFVEG